MIVNLKRNILEFIKSHELSVIDIEYVNYISKEDGSLCSCDFSELLDVAEDINFEDHDPLIKHREQLHQNISIVADEWYITRSTDPAVIWEYHGLPALGDYKELYEEDLIDLDDIIDNEILDLITHESPNADYVRDNIMILDELYRIENNDGIEQVVNKKGCVAVILACNPNGRYWTVPTTSAKDPQILYHPELVKIVSEYRANNPIEGYQLKDGDIATVFDIDELSTKYNLDFGPIGNQHFNNLQVVWMSKNTDYVIDFSGAASHEDLRHEVIYPLSSMNVIST